MESKDIIILILGIMGSLIATIIIDNIIKLDTITFLFALLIILAISTSIIAWILYKKITESEEAISELKIKQKRIR